MANRVKVKNQNESWLSLAKKFLGTEREAGRLAKANPGVYAIKKGMTVKLPTVPVVKKQNTGWQGGFRVPTGSGDITGKYPAVQQPKPSAVQQASFNPRNFIQGAAVAPAAYISPVSSQMATTYNLPVNEDDYIPGKVPGNYVPGLGRVTTPAKLPGVGPTLPGYIPPKKVVPKLPAPSYSPSFSNLSIAMGANPGTYQPAFISGAARGAASAPAVQNTGWQGGFVVPTGSGDITGQYPPMYASNWGVDQSGLAPASPYLSPYAYNVPVEFPVEGKPGTTMTEMMASGQWPKSMTIPVQQSLGLSNEEMIAAGYVMINGVWVDNYTQASSGGGGGGGSSGKLRSSTGRSGGGGGRSSSYGGYGSFPGQQGYYANPALLGLVSWRI